VGLAAFAGAVKGSPAEAAGLEGILYYSVAYTFMNLGAFAVVTALQDRPGVTSQIASFAGFIAKWYIIQAALQTGGWLNVLAVVTVLNAAVAAFYYLRIVVVMYMQEVPEGTAPLASGWLTRAGLVLAAAGTIVVGLIPGLVIPMAQAAAAAIH
jgi:NADH-quinone oxidoreductase subunit N